MSGIKDVLQFVRGFDRIVEQGIPCYAVYAEFDLDWSLFQCQDKPIQCSRLADPHNPEVATTRCVFWGAEQDVELDDIYDFIGKTARINVEAQQKKVLFDTKVREMRDLFASYDLDVLKDLQFVLPDVPMDEEEAVDEPKEADELSVDASDMLPKAVKDAVAKKAPVKAPAQRKSPVAPAPKKPAKSRARVVPQVVEGDIDIDADGDEVQTHMTGLSLAEMQQIDL